MENLTIDISAFKGKYVYLLASKKIQMFFYIGLFLLVWFIFFSVAACAISHNHFFIRIPLIILGGFLAFFFARVCDLIDNLNKQINNLNGKGNQNLNPFQKVGFKITLNKDGYVKLPYQKLVPNLAYEDTKGEITNTLLYQYDSMISSDEIDFYTYDLENELFMERLSDFCNQKPKTIINNVKRMELTNKEMIDLVINLYKLKEIKYKNDIIDNLFKEDENKQVYQEKNIHSQIDDELAKIRKKLK